MESIEPSLINDLYKNDRVILAIGQKGAGKTTLLLNYIKFALHKNIYDEYHMFLPSYEYEQNNLYDFIKKKIIKIYLFMIIIMKL